MKCKFYIVRVSIAEAVSAGEISMYKQNHNDSFSSRMTLNDIPAKLKECADFLERTFFDVGSEVIISQFDLVPRTRGLASNNLNEVNDILSKSADSLHKIEVAIPAIIQIAEMAQVRIKQASNEWIGEDHWKQGFIERLGYTWYRYTKKKPPKSVSASPFSNFVDAAYQLLGGNADGITPKMIRSTVESIEGVAGNPKMPGREVWNKFDRYGKKLLPPA